jgi:hypothetical protein
VATDGTKIQGNASRHKAMSYGYMKKEGERLREDIEALVTQAYQQDEADDAALGSRRGDELPAELARREDRLARLEAAMRRLEAQAKAERHRTGQKRRGKAPTPVEESPDDKAQSNFTDPELPIMRTNNKGWESCGNAPASVDGACQIILACDVTEASNDKQQAEPVAQAPLATLTQAGLERPKVTALEGQRSSNRHATAAPAPADATGERWRASWQTRPDPTGLSRRPKPPRGGDDGPQTCAATLTDYRGKHRERSAPRG